MPDFGLVPLCLSTRWASPSFSLLLYLGTTRKSRLLVNHTLTSHPALHPERRWQMLLHTHMWSFHLRHFSSFVFPSFFSLVISTDVECMTFVSCMSVSCSSVDIYFHSVYHIFYISVFLALGAAWEQGCPVSSLSTACIQPMTWNKWTNKCMCLSHATKLVISLWWPFW